MAYTKHDLINVEVFAQGVTEKLAGKLKAIPYAYRESFEGQQVGSIKVPKTAYIGDASVVAKGEEIPFTALSQSSVDVPLEKFAQATEIADEDARGGFGQPLSIAENQLVASIAGGMENKVISELQKATLKVEAAKADYNAVLEALGKMGDSIEDAPYFLLYNPAQFQDLQEGVVTSDKTGVLPKIAGAEIVMSNKVPAGELFLVQNGVVGIYSAKEVNVEDQRDASRAVTELVATEMAAIHLRDESKVVHITIGA